MHKILENWESEILYPQKFHLNQLADFSLNYLELKSACFVSLNYIGEESIQKLNAKYRDINQATDILSFEWDVIQYEFALENDKLWKNQKSSYKYLGDIFICEAQAKQKHAKYFPLLKDIYELLIVHGILHLNGFDHKTDLEAEIMQNKEQEILKAYHSSDK